MKTTGEKIRESRTHLGLTQTELADKIGVAAHDYQIRLSDCLEEKLLILLRDISTSKESTRLCQQLLYISCSFTAIGCSCALDVWWRCP